MSGDLDALPTNVSNEPCSEFETFEYVIVALLSAASGLVSVLACLLSIALLVAFKKHRFFVQRLILYLCVAALLNSLANALRLQRIGYQNDESAALHGLCIATAYVDQSTAWSELLAIVCITINLLVSVVFQKETAKAEPVYFVLIFIIPFLFNWVPFIDESYGKSGAWCWIRSINFTTCEKHVTGVYFQYVFWYVPLYAILAVLLLVYLFIIYKVFRQRHHWEGKYDPQVEAEKEMMQAQVKPLFLYPLGYLILNIFPLINRLQGTISPNNPVYALWILHALFSPLQGGYIAIVFARETLQNVNCASLRGNLFQKDAAVKEYPVRTGRSDSFVVLDADKSGEDKEVHATLYTAAQDSIGSTIQN